ncbi:hypothetical protein CRM82_15055 [Comamonas terrigena]|uniref:Uncharacterized protein n=1 Tax=Comamonas terrigena TaxID=32013 RepID=A0A2A7UX28_COMTR|nr:hypothetical protein [Comamonas terrigena]PEH89741.1 hypothetical protein CRM82_15055 [Comamonas terrigena]
MDETRAELRSSTTALDGVKGQLFGSRWFLRRVVAWILHGHRCQMAFQPRRNLQMDRCYLQLGSVVAKP